ncbi:exonuclease SbcCD subunit D [Actinotignum schaalii]|uniref:exonuclease SbcCD subunit D n=1 Tax=Actinotignum schaalii TaxID=59505 RepID=UPI0003F52EC9|nr:exonuclease SbcCD subunit D [Actinotignum schaalii]WQN45424.1 exonuclease SbcCD subunit D [Actinotignum schaalii]
MKILHTSDWHLGRTLHRADLTPAFELWVDHVVDTVRERGVDALLISGDVYDRSVPPAPMVELFSRTLRRLAQLTTVILISGNHDSPQRLGFGAELFQERIVIRTDPLRCAQPVEVRDQAGNLGALVYPIPYLDPDVERRRLAGGDAHAGCAYGAELLERSHAAVMRAALERIAADIQHGPHAGKPVARIAMAHAFVAGGAASESERDISVGGVEVVPAALFALGGAGASPTAGLSYVALGHLHSPQRVGSAPEPGASEASGLPPMRYSGSPIAFSFSETRPKSSVLLTFEGGALVEEELIPAPVWRPIVTIEAPLAEVLSPAHRNDRDKFARILVTDPARPADLTTRVRAAFPHALEIRHVVDPAATRHSTADTRRLDALSVLRQFMTESGHRDLTEEENRVMVAAWEAVRTGEKE